MKKVIKSSEYIACMALINPQLTEQSSILVEVFQQNEGPIPHVHVFHDKTRNKKKCSLVRLDKPEYSDHHDKIVVMPKKVKEEFLKIMTAKWPKHIVENPDGTFRPATGYEAAVDIWVDTFEKGSYNKFPTDENGNLISIDYSNL